jgi:hypothetical protein
LIVRAYLGDTDAREVLTAIPSIQITDKLLAIHKALDMAQFEMLLLLTHAGSKILGDGARSVTLQLVCCVFGRYIVRLPGFTILPSHSPNQGTQKGVGNG